jgi:hypothetical protein
MTITCAACGHEDSHHLWGMCDVEDVPMADGRLRDFCGCPGYEPTEAR